jgi:hypothetical protein
MASRYQSARPQGRPALPAPWPNAIVLCLVFFVTAAGSAETAPGRSKIPSEARSLPAPGPLASFSLPSISAPDYWVRADTGLAVSRESLDSHWHSLVQQPDARSEYTLSTPDVLERWGRLTHSPASIELYPSHLLAFDPERTVRPHLELGSSSDSLRSWLRDAGLNASTCIAPLMKMHSTIAGSGPRTNVSVSARCSFH